MYRYLLLAMLSCLGCRTDRVTAAPVDQPEDPESPAASAPMAEHFLKGEKLRDAIIAGDLEGSKPYAQWLVDNLVAEDMPAVYWKTNVPKTKRAAKHVVDAKTLGEASAAAGKLAAACGDCHADAKIQLRAPERPSPLKDETTFAQMDRHAYAAQRMWDGLVGALDDAWIEGATLMRDAPLHPDGAPEPVTTLAATVHELATTAIDLPVKDRGQRFGEIINTCATCHELAG